MTMQKIVVWIVILATLGCQGLKKAKDETGLEKSFPHEEKKETLVKMPTYLGTKTPYFPQQLSNEYEKPPEGCDLVHLSGIFRHGSRFDTKEDSLKEIEEALIKAKKNNELTKKGNEALQWITEVRKIFRAEELTEQGKIELFEIGKRAFQRHSSLFINGTGKILLRSTYKNRAKESRDSFLKGLLSTEAATLEQSKIEKIDFEKCNDVELRFFDSCKLYTAEYQKDSKKVKKQVSKTIQNDESNTNSIRKDLDSIFLSKMENDKAWDIIGDIYKLCQQDYSIDYKKGEERFCSLLSPKSKELLYREKNAGSYYKSGPVIDIKEQKYHRVTSSMACKAVVPIIREIEKVVSGANDANTAYLAFAHAETVTPLSVFFQLFPESLELWSSSEVSPKASNLQLETYACKSDKNKSFKIRMLYNEKELHFPISACKNSYFCDWGLVKEYFEHRTAENGIPSCSNSTWAAYCKNESESPKCYMQGKKQTEED